MKTTSGVLDDIAAIPFQNYIVKNDRLIPQWHLELSHHYRVQNGQSDPYSVGTSSHAAGHFLRVVGNNDVLRALATNRLRGGIGHCEPRDTPLAVLNGFVHFYQNRINWTWQADLIIPQFFGRLVYEALTDVEREAFDFAVPWNADPRTNFCEVFRSVIYNKASLLDRLFAGREDHWARAKTELVVMAIERLT